MMDERGLEELAKQLGAARAQRLNVEEAAQAVQRQLHRVGRARGAVVRWRARALTAAAAVVLIAGGWLVLNWVGVGRDGETQVVVAPYELQELGTGDLSQVLDSLELQGPVHELVSPGLEDLTVGELRQLLQTMEG